MRQRSSIEKAGRRLERAFTLRLWCERGETAPSAVRGSIVELESGRRFFFAQISDLEEFLRLRVAALVDPATPPATS